MFVVSLSSKKVKRALSFFFAFTVVITGAVVLFTGSRGNAQNNASLLVNSTAENMQQILEYISQLGWEVSTEPDEIREIVIPTEFDETYNKYNEIQLSQGYDLSKYAGERVKSWSFTVLNYPGYENKECIKLNLLVCDGEIIGGDVCSVELNGFMHSLIKE